MKITFVGLSCYLIEDRKGGRLLIDIFKDEPRYSFGFTLPKNLIADIFLASHADADHGYLDERFTEHKKPNDEKKLGAADIFPNFNLRGTIAQEWNGDLCIAYHFTVDGLRCLHLADSSHPLTASQLKEFGKIDVLFLPMPKSKNDNIEMELKIIMQLRPNIIIPSHLIPMSLKNIERGYDFIYKKLAGTILSAKQNPNADAQTVKVFSWMLICAEKLSRHFPTKIIDSPIIEIKKLPKKPTIYYFEKCLARK